MKSLSPSLTLTTTLFAVFTSSALLGCRGETSKDPPIVPIRNMYNQPKYEIQEESTYYSDHRSMRPPVEGAVAREADLDPETHLGRLPDDSGYVLTVPRQIIDGFGGMAQTLARGQDRYGIYCVPCHDATGSGHGAVVKHAVAAGAAAFQPPTYHQDRLRHAPDGQIFATITNGIRNMPPYGYQIPERDRWAIITYVRALQVSQASVGPEQNL